MGCTEEEIADMLKCDKEIDRGADLFPLAEELQAGAKKARRADRTDTPKKAERTRVEDKDKRRLITFLKNALENEINLDATTVDHIGTDVEIVNPEREFLFTYNGKKYKVVLSCPRS
jgi:hypothetical protein